MTERSASKPCNEYSKFKRVEVVIFMELAAEINAGIIHNNGVMQAPCRSLYVMEVQAQKPTH